MRQSNTSNQLKQTEQPAIWRIFCSVVDNFGDIGICWRLSRQLVAEHGICVQLWVDDLVSFQRICPQIVPTKRQQRLEGVEIFLWPAEDETAELWQQLAPAAVVIEALACTIPDGYQQQMACQPQPPLWFNLEYLSAEHWVEGCHGLSSPQPQTGLNKYFFFPGFTHSTGGLLYEHDLQVRLDCFADDKLLQQRFWQQLGVVCADYSLKISIFAYSHSQLADLLQQWQQLTDKVLCVIPQGVLAEQLITQHPLLGEGKILQLNSLYLKIIPFVTQPDYDLLLRACDLNFVRGEDSIIRAHWAGQPFVWQIYRQQENAHLIKLQAFLSRYCQNMPAALASVMQQFYFAWNTDDKLSGCWQDFYPLLTEITTYNQLWRQQLLANGDLASNLVHFAQKKFIITPNFSQQ